MDLDKLTAHVLSHLLEQGKVHRDHLHQSIQETYHVPDHEIPEMHRDLGRLLDKLHAEGMLIPNPGGWLQLSPIGADEAARMVGGYNPR